jgi:hypothetical protein
MSWVYLAHAGVSMAVCDITRQRWQAAAAAARCAGPVSKPVLHCWNAGLLGRVCASNASNVGERIVPVRAVAMPVIVVLWWRHESLKFCEYLLDWQEVTAAAAQLGCSLARYSDSYV